MHETRAFVGTLPYMAPEQLRGNGADVRTDIYAIGAVLYEMATGQRPFRKTFAPELVEEILNNVPASPTALNRHISRRLQAIILKCLEKDPGKRYQNAKELLDDLAPLAATAIRYRPWLAATAALTTIALVTMTALFSTREPARSANRSITANPHRCNAEAFTDHNSLGPGCPRIRRPAILIAEQKLQVNGRLNVSVWENTIKVDKANLQLWEPCLWVFKQFGLNCRMPKLERIVCIDFFQ